MIYISISILTKYNTIKINNSYEHELLGSVSLSLKSIVYRNLLPLLTVILNNKYTLTNIFLKSKNEKHIL